MRSYDLQFTPRRGRAFCNDRESLDAVYAHACPKLNPWFIQIHFHFIYSDLSCETSCYWSHCIIKSEVFYKLLRNQPIGLYFHDFVMIQTCAYLFWSNYFRRKSDEVELISNFFNRKSISRNTAHPQSWHLQIESSFALQSDFIQDHPWFHYGAWLPFFLYRIIQF